VNNKNFEVVILDKKELINISDYVVGFFAGIYAGLVVLFADEIMPISDWWGALLFLLVVLCLFFMGFFCIMILNSCVFG
jgi:hypothetical protein